MKCILLACLIVCLSSWNAAADSLYGVNMTGSFSANDPANRAGTSFTTGPTFGAYLQQDSYSYVNGASVADTVYDSSQDALVNFSASASVDATVSLGDFQATLLAGSSGYGGTLQNTCGPVDCYPLSSDGGATLASNWYDTITFGGAPVGTPEEFLVTTSFVTALTGATYPYTGADASYNTSLGNCNTFEQVNSTTPNVNDVGTCILTAYAGETLQASGSFTMTALSTTEYEGYGSSADAQTFDPAFFLDAITPGATYSTASGVTYFSTPEPNLLWLSLLLMAVFCGVHVFRTRRSSSTSSPHC
ncbi:MAG TPA: hypothetical protein VME17_14215 [Bryobacteraceae bacterium]|nr:hypothetical protein [Bryobacteraceae bacterium]